MIKPIGYLESVYREKFGTPRQSGFVKNARARLTMVNDINASCLEGLEDYGYIWLVFIFHIGLNDYNNKKSKIAPPKLEGKKKGVFATRSPHRYNPIGLSLAKLDKVKGRTIYISGADLIHGTPIIDIKPYHYLDSLDEETVLKSTPDWLLESKERGRLHVKYGENSRQELQEIIDAKQLDFYDNFDDISKVIQEVFELNPHSVHTLNKHKEGIYAVALDNLNIVYIMDEEKTEVVIVKIIYVNNTVANSIKAPDQKLRTKQWLEKMNEIMDFRGFKASENEVLSQDEDGEEEKKEGEE